MLYSGPARHTPTTQPKFGEIELQVISSFTPVELLCSLIQQQVAELVHTRDQARIDEYRRIRLFEDCRPLDLGTDLQPQPVIDFRLLGFPLDPDRPFFEDA